MVEKDVGWKGSLGAVALAALGLGLASGCAPDDPLDFGGPRDCSIPEQNAFAYTLMQKAYLWSDEVPTDIDPAIYESPSELVTDLRGELDRWSRVSDLETSEALFEEGMVIGMGFRTRTTQDDRLVLGFVDPQSPAGLAGLRRGDELVGAAGFTAPELNESDGWSDAFGPNEPGVEVDLQFRREGQDVQSVSVTKDWYPLVTVPQAEIVEHEGSPVGYLFFTTFVEPSQEELDDAFEQFAEAGVRELVIDLRYNGGGRISTAHHLMNLLVGTQASGEVAYRTDYAEGLSEANNTRRLSRQGASLTTLDHVVFITTGSTASASELVINAVRPWTAVSVVGSATAGKPVGSAQFAFCDKAAYPITFRLLNARGEGDYFDGFAPDCSSPDDLSAQLGAPEEASMTAALARLRGESCPDFSVDDGEEGDGEAQVPEARGVRTTAPLPGAYPGLDEMRGRY